jgi:tape measure domain-containing protein
MPGPIETAFVEIVARLEAGDLESQLTSALSRAVSKAEPQFTRLEKAGVEAASGISAAFKRSDLNLDTRAALQALGNIDKRAERTINALDSLTVNLNDDQAVAALNRLEDEVQQTLESIRTVDGETVTLNAQDAEAQLRRLLLAADDMGKELGDLADRHVDLNVEPAISQVNRLGESVAAALRDVETLDGQTVTVNVEDLSLETLVTDVNRAQRAVRELDALHPVVNAKFDEEGFVNQARRAGNEGSSQLERAFKRVFAFGIAGLVTQQAFQAVRQLFTAGVQAAGAIQNVEVALNRFFANTKNLGENASSFFLDIRKLALTTPFQFADLAEASRRILAIGESAKQTQTTLVALTDAVAAVGGGTEQINGVVRALSQLSSKGKIDLQDLRQISEQLPSLPRQMQIQGFIDALNELHPDLHATIGDFTALRTSGLITSQVIQLGLVKAMQSIPGAAGAAEAASRTLQGALSNLKDFVTTEFADAFQGLGAQIADQLNTAFGSITQGGALSSVAKGLQDLLRTFGRAGELVLPDLFSGFAKASGPLATLVQQLGELAHAIMPAVTNAGVGVLHTLTGLTDVARLGAEALSLLPAPLQEITGEIAVLATLSPKIRAALITDPLIAFRQALFGIREGEDAVALGATLMEAALTLGAIVVLSQVLDSFAASDEAARKFNEQVADAAKTLQDFTTVGEGVSKVLDDLNSQNKNIELGNTGFNFVKQAETVGQLAQQLGTTADGVGQIAEAMSRGSASGDAFAGALRSAGISTDDFNGLSTQAKQNLEALAQTLSLAAKQALAYDISSRKFALVNTDQALALQKAADKTGDYAGAIDQLNVLNKEAAAVAFKTIDATDAQREAALRANTTIDESGQSTIDYVGALQDLYKQLQQTDDIFSSMSDDFAGFDLAFSKLTDGVGNSSDEFVKFAVAADKAKLSGDQLNAIANKLGPTFTEALSGLPELTGAQLQQIFAGVTTQIGVFKTALDSVTPGISDLQGAANSFTLDSFVAELEKIAVARANVVGNMQKLIDQFGDLGAKALAALAQSGLNKDQFAAVLQDALSGGPEKLKELIFAFGAAGSDSLDSVAVQLEAHGLNQEEVRKILGVDAFKSDTGDIAAFVAGLRTSLESELGKIESLKFTADPRWKSELDNEIGDLRSQIGGTFDTAGGTLPVPQIDIPKAVASATDAGSQVSSAFDGTVTTGVTAAMATVDSTVNSSLQQTSVIGSLNAFVTGTAIGGQLSRGVTLATLSLPVEIIGVMNSTLALLNLTQIQFYAKGVSIGVGLGQGLIDGVNSKLAQAYAAGAGVAAQAEAGARDTSKTKSPSQVFDGIGRDLVAGLVQGVKSSMSQSTDVMAQAVNQMADAGSPQPLADSIAAVFNTLIYRINNAFLLLAGRLGVSEIFAGSPVRQFAQGVVATSPTFGRFAEAGPEAILPLGDGAAAARIIAQLVPYIGAQGRAAAADLLGLSDSSPGRADGAGGSTWHNEWNVTVPTDDPELFARRAAARLERRMTR